MCFSVSAVPATVQCVFSNGGQFFAAINGNLIQVFNTYTYDVVANYKGHSNKVSETTVTIRSI